MKKNRSDGIES